MLPSTPLSHPAPAGAGETTLAGDTADLVEVVHRLSLVGSPSELQRVVSAAARRLTGADGATLVLREGDQCHYAEEDSIAPLWKGRRFPLASCVSGWAMLNRRAVRIDDIYMDDRVPKEAYLHTFVRSMVIAPIRTAAPVGTIGTYWARCHRPTNCELALVQALADSTAVAMENLRMVEALENAHLDGLHRLAAAAEHRDDGTREHPLRVGRTAFLIAERLAGDDLYPTWVAQAAPLHDVGKLAVPDSILLKPGQLTAAEFEIVKGHTVAGADILDGSHSRLLDLAREVALTHHERFDGTGYPDGLAGERIPLSGRIVALADVFDALTHARPYKQAWPVEAAVQEILRLRGTHFDPDVVDAFRAIGAESLIELPRWWSPSAHAQPVIAGAPNPLLQTPSGVVV